MCYLVSILEFLLLVASIVAMINVYQIYTSPWLQDLCIAYFSLFPVLITRTFYHFVRIGQGSLLVCMDGWPNPKMRGRLLFWVWFVAMLWILALLLRSVELQLGLAPWFLGFAFASLIFLAIIHKDCVFS